MTFKGLPEDLKNVISDFAYTAKWKVCEKDLETCKEIEKLDVPLVFTREMMWSGKYVEYIPSPLVAFEPIQNFSNNWADYFDWHTVREFLWRLDFRRTWVKTPYTREQWRELCSKNWRNITFFVDYFYFLMYSKVECFKPAWKALGFGCLQSFRSPHISARWWLYDGF